MGERRGVLSLQDHTRAKNSTSNNLCFALKLVIFFSHSLRKFEKFPFIAKLTKARAKIALNNAA